MTSITPNERLLKTTLTDSDRMSEALRQLRPQDIEQAVGIALRQQVNVSAIGSLVRTQRLVEKKVLNEQR